jgi:hypothetical protein
MDVRRASVLVLGTVIALAFLASFVSVPVPSQPNVGVNLGNGTFTGSYALPKPKYVYNFTIVLSPDLTDLQYIKSSYSDLSPPYYTVPHTNNTILFNFTDPANNTLKLLLKALAWNATKIAPGAYGDLLSIADSAYVNVINYTNVILEPFPLNPNDTEDYSKWEIIVVYAKDFEPPSGFQPGWSYPPSDSVTVYPLSYKVINETTVQTDVRLGYYYLSEYLEYYYSYQEGNTTYYYYYYGMRIAGDACLYVNGKLAVVEYFNNEYPWYGGQYGPYYLSTTVTVPPGVAEEVSGYYIISLGYTVYTAETTSGNMTYIYYFYEPTGPYITTQGYTYNWYEYNVSLPLSIKVFNGTDPVTYVNGYAFYNRSIYARPWYTVWSSLPEDFTVNVMTDDNIQVAGYTVNREWHAGWAEITADPLALNFGNTIDYLLYFSDTYNFAEPPSWIFQKMTYNETAPIRWFYLEQNASLAHSLYVFINKTINETDRQFWKFEYFVLADEFVMYTFNTTYSVGNNTLILESFYENWSLVNASILNLTYLLVHYKFKYMNGTLMFFNVSRIPEIYNASIYFNVTGNYEVYLTDVYNGLEFPHWDKIPFGNIYNFTYPPENRTVYIYYSDSTNSSTPYIGEELDFVTANYIYNLTFATFRLPGGRETQITAIWNGTAWLT